MREFPSQQINIMTKLLKEEKGFQAACICCCFFQELAEFANASVGNVRALLECRLLWSGGDCGLLKGIYIV